MRAHNFKSKTRLALIMVLICSMCERDFDQKEEGALFITECYPRHIGDPPEIFHFCTYNCIKEWCS